MDRRRYLVRAGAVALDLMMCLVGVLLVGFVLGVFAGPRASAVGGMVVALAYSLVEAFRAQSFGKHFLDLKVRMLDGSEVRGRVLLQRWATKHAPTIFGTLAVVTGLELFAWLALPAAFVVALGFLMALHPDCQALHDWVNGTTVTRLSGPAAQADVAGPIPMRQPPQSKAA